MFSSDTGIGIGIGIGSVGGSFGALVLVLVLSCANGLWSKSNGDSINFTGNDDDYDERAADDVHSYTLIQSIGSNSDHYCS